MKEKYKQFLARMRDESGASFLEAVIYCVVVCVITAYLMNLMGVVLNMGELRNSFTSSTGWFKTSDITGIMP